MLPSRAVIAVAAAVGLLALAFAGPVYAESKGTGISTDGSPHNFKDDFCIVDPVANNLAISGASCNESVWNTNNDLCKVCHVPHSTGTPRIVLWNHTDTTSNYTIYDSAWSNTVQGTTGQPDGVSKNCLGCHDGTVAVDSYGGGPATPSNTIGDGTSGYHTNKDIGGPGGVDLTGQHPVSIVFDGSLVTADGFLNNPTTTNFVGTSVIDNFLDSNNKIQCSTCHDVHDEETFNTTADARGYLLRVTNTNSDICLRCHDK